MRESTERQRRRNMQYPHGAPLCDVDDDRARKAIDDRSTAVRRWIEDEDEAAVRGID